MKNVANSTYSEIMGLDEFLDRYTNPINREMYNELLNIFIIFTKVLKILNILYFILSQQLNIMELK